jgi:drug/metabolite transporter (DMT)-like permease
MIPLGLVFGAMIGLFLASMKATTAANTIYLQYTATFWIVPIAWLTLGERPDRRAAVGIVLAMAGIAVIAGYGHSGRPGEWRGLLLGLGSGVAYAGVAVGMRALRGLDPVWLSAVNNLLGALALGAWMTLTARPPAVPTGAQAVGLLAFGVVQMAIPYALFARGLREVTAPEAGLIALAEPILNPVWTALVTGERPGFATLLGGALLLSGIALRYLPMSGRGRRLTSRGSAPIR